MNWNESPNEHVHGPSRKVQLVHTIKITTFKESGKYYDKWTLEVHVEQDTWYDIIETVRHHKASTSPRPLQSDMDWLIGIDDSRDDMYPIILKG